MNLASFKLVSLFFVASVSITAAAGCSSSEPVAAEETEQGVDELNASASCGAKYGQALVHYKKAVKLAKEPYAKGHCGDVDGEGSIEDEAATAVMLCPAFKEVIKNSPWAAPIRDVLADMLTLRSLTGELLVLRNTEFQNWSNVEQFLPGTVMWANGAWGLYWMQDEIRFEANGKAVHVHYGEGPSEKEYVKEETTPATYRVEKTGAEKDKRKVTVSWGGKTEKFDLVVQDTEPGDFKSAPVFSLRHSDPAKSFSTMKDCSM